MTGTYRYLAAGLAASALLLAGCASNDPDDGASGGTGIEVVATTTVWGDVAGQVVACAGNGSVATLMPVGVDPHDFTASSKGVAAVAGADLVIANGLGLEEGLADSLAAVAQEGVPVLELAPLLDPIPFGAGDGHAEDEGHAEDAAAGHDGDDPHVWLDASRVARAATLIGAGPASLTVARDLLPLGYRCVLFEKDARGGGLMRSNIPSFRLPETVLDEEMAQAEGGLNGNP